MAEERISIFAIEWDTKSRTQKYNYLRYLGATPSEARRGRDLNWKRIDDYSKTFKGPIGGGPKIKLPKARGGFYALTKKEKIEWWRQLSAHWNKGPYKANLDYEQFNKWQKQTSVKWPKEAIELNRYFWDQLTASEKLIYPWSSAETHSAGYVIVYRHYIEGKSWEKSMEGILIKPEEAYEEDWY